MIFQNLKKVQIILNKLYISYTMPDARCAKCGLTLGPICKTVVEIKRFSDLVDKRSSKLLGFITSISPGIKHNEIDTSSECDGVLWYEALAQTPSNVLWGS